MMEYIDVEFDGWEDRAVIKKMEQEARLRDDYLEMLMRYMQRKSKPNPWPDRLALTWWDDFKAEYPDDGADLEKWLEARHE